MKTTDRDRLRALSNASLDAEQQWSIARNRALSAGIIDVLSDPNAKTAGRAYDRAQQSLIDALVDIGNGEIAQTVLDLLGDKSVSP